MSDVNIKLVQNVYGAYARRDLAAVMEACAPDVAWGMSGRREDLPLQGVHAGRAGVGAFFRDMAEMVEITSFQPQRFLAAGDKVFVWGRWSWIMRNSGRPGENEWLHVFTIADGKVAEWRGYNDGAQLLAAYRAPPAVRLAAAG
mgnify:CR=1 FL=1